MCDKKAEDILQGIQQKLSEGVGVDIDVLEVIDNLLSKTSSSLHTSPYIVCPHCGYKDLSTYGGILKKPLDPFVFVCNECGNIFGARIYSPAMYQSWKAGESPSETEK